MAYDAAHDQMTLFGGLTTSPSSIPMQDTWLWQVDHWASVNPTTKPGARLDQAMAYDAVRQRVVIMGGHTNYSGGALLGDTWTWDGTNWSPQTTPAALTARFGAAMAWDPVHQVIVLFGGENDANEAISGDVYYNDTWTWDGTSWTQAAGLGPNPRAFGRLVWDASRSRMVLLGGKAFLPVADAWEWDGHQWTLLPVTNTLLAAYPTAIPSLDGAGAIVLGGVLELGQLQPFSPVHLEWSSPSAHYEVCNQGDVDHDGLVGCADPDCWYACTPACPPSTTCMAGGMRCGDGTCDAALESCDSCPADCGQCTSVCGDFVCATGESCPNDCP
jgi:hypothetical protein